MSKLVIRRFRSDEKPVWTALWDGYMSDEAAPDRRLAARGWKCLRDKGHPYKALLALIDGTPAGFISTVERFDPHTVKPQCYISCLYVLPEFRRRSIASNLMKNIMAQMEEGRYAKVEWKTMKKNHIAQALYKSLATRTTWVIYERKPDA